MVKEEFAKEMEWFCEYYKYNMDIKQSKVWFDLSNKYTVSEWHKALMEHIRISESTFFPAFGNIEKLVVRENRRMPLY